MPSWHDASRPGAINIVLDPGLAFGTGTHPTTRLCLRWLAATVRGGENVIDFGCGSGILAIAAMKLGAARASGVDIDPQAVTAARENAARNGVAATFVSAAEHLPTDPRRHRRREHPRAAADRARAAAGRARPRTAGGIALSGILVEQAHEVGTAYAAWYDFEPAQEEDGWVLVSGTRRPRSV